MSVLKNMFEPKFFEEWLREKKRLSESSIGYYVRVVTKFLNEYSQPTLNNLNEFIINNAIKKRQTAFYSIMKAYVQYKYTDAGDRNQIIDNLVKPPVPDGLKVERETLSEEEILKLINNLEYMKHRIIALIQDLSGIRAGDALRIRRGEIIPEIYDDSNVLKIIIHGKGDKRNVIYIHDDIVQELIINFIIKNRLSDEYYFMENRSRIEKLNVSGNRNYHANYIAYFRDLKQSMAKTGIEHKSFATHDYRRCYARRVWNKFKDLHVLQELLNHENPATTMRYLKQSGLKNIEYHKQMQN